jgi:hypothetical protein
MSDQKIDVKCRSAWYAIAELHFSCICGKLENRSIQGLVKLTIINFYDQVILITDFSPFVSKKNILQMICIQIYDRKWPLAFILHLLS